jgi:hypothetical protein
MPRTLQDVLDLVFQHRVHEPRRVLLRNELRKSKEVQMTDNPNNNKR